jgi:hypothetical protein
MKKCSYCGAEYPDDAAVCSIDQTALDGQPSAPSFLRALQSPAGLAVTSGLAAFLITTGIFSAVGRVSLHIYKIHHPVSFAPPYAREAFIMYPLVGWLLMIAFVVFTFAVCWLRCQKRWQAIVAAVITLGILALPLFSAGFLSIVPALAIGVATDSSAGYYIVAAVQICVGAWLLGWVRRPTPPNTALEPTPTAP